MKSILIISFSLDATGLMALQESFRHLGYEAEVGLVQEEGIAERVMQADKVIFRIRPSAYTLFTQLQDQLSGLHRDELDRILTAFDKVETCKVLGAKNIPIPQSWEIKSDYEPTQYPFVIKIPRGNQGEGIALIRTKQDLEGFFATYSDERFLGQEFIAEAASNDKRLFVVGDKVVTAMRRSAGTDEFRANLHLGGTAEKYDPTQEETALAIQSVQAFGIEFAGVDIIDSDRGPLVLEVNPSPGFGVGKITGVDVVELVALHILGETHD